MGKQFIQDIAAGDRVKSIFAVSKCECRSSKNGDQFLSLTLMDKTGRIDAKRWRVPADEAALVSGLRYVLIDGVAEEYGGKLQLSIKIPIQDAGLPENPEDFEVRAKLPFPELTRRFDGLMDSVRDPRLKALLNNFFCDPDFRAKFDDAPAAQGLHHACRHGLLQHTLEVTEMAEAIVRVQQNWGYPEVSRDLVVTGALLHDIGKVYELKRDGVSCDYTRMGRLLGHITIGFQLIVLKSKEIPGFSTTLRDALSHVILAHHGKGEFGSPVTPMLREAQIVHVADDLNVRLFYMTQAAEEAAEGQDFIDHWAIEGRKVYVGPLDVQSEEAIMTTRVHESPAPLAMPNLNFAPASLPILHFATAENSSTAFKTRRIPLVGSIAAGMPLLAEERIEDYFELDCTEFAADKELFLLCVKGDSMIGDGIASGDLILVRSHDHATPGEILVALVDDEATVKRVHREPDGSFLLMPSNPDHAPIPVSDPSSLKIQGQVVGIVRS